MPKRKPNDPDRSADLPHNWVERHLERAEELVYFNSSQINNWKYRNSRLVSEGRYEDIDTTWNSIRLGEQWGGEDITAFFEKELVIPETLCPGEKEELILDINLDGGECQLKLNGRLWQGLDRFRRIVPLKDEYQAGDNLLLELEAFVINYPYDTRSSDERVLHTFSQARFMLMDNIISDFVQDARFILNAYMAYWRDDSNLEIEEFLLYHLKEACRILGPVFSNRQEARELCKKASAYLDEYVYRTNFYRSNGIVNTCGHSHLDIVYLWPVKETFRKNCRTATNMLSLMREYPEFKYSSSQPYLFEKLKEMYPGVFDEVKQRIKEKRWEVTGGMYIEPDGNLLGAESLVRQIMFGKRFYQEEFDINTEVCWLPDVFGVMYTLPQILKKCGINYFSSIKLNIWNDTNDFPYNTFKWRGPDGSEVLTHFPPTHFAGDCRPEIIRKNWDGFKEKNNFGESLFLYGWADGGGGPTREMVEAAKRSDNFPGLPQCRTLFVEDYLKKLDSGKNLPVWDDEFYLEAHRGTYTSKADLKSKNRKNELLYRDAEILSALAFASGMDFSMAELNEGWKLLLVNQFHDTLPGSHVPESVPDIYRDYEKLENIGIKVKIRAMEYLMSGMSGNHDFALFNTLSWNRASVVSVPYTDNVLSVKLGGELLVCQKKGDELFFDAPSLPSLGWICGSVSPESVKSVDTASAIAMGIESPFYRIEWNSDGWLNSIYDKTYERQVLQNLGNELLVFEDDPGKNFGAWDIASHYEEYSYDIELIRNWKLKENGPVFAELEGEWKVLGSRIIQIMRIYKNHRHIEFDTFADWQDSKKLLKSSFDLAVRSRRASYDLPFGHIERTTHSNTSWDQARFEVCGHKWADISEGDYGVALMNDCKYGYDTRGNVMRLSLIRSPVKPDGKSDLGEHHFSYALLPHRGIWQLGAVDRKAYEFNIPPISAPFKKSTGLGEFPWDYSFLSLEGEGQIIEVLKVSEDSKGLILRCFDSHNTHSRVKVKINHGLGDCYNTDLLENPESSLTQTGNELSLDFSPMEIKTCKLVLTDKPL